MIRFGRQVATLATINFGLLAAATAYAGSWQNNAPFGATLQGDLYTPTTPAASPAILVSIHYCSGTSSNAHGWFQSYADQYGFYIIAPNAGKNCFDSSISRSGDPAAIVKMVQYVITNKNANASRVFSAGLSSGGCMTNTLLAIYPDVFVGGAAMPGFPAGLWPVGDTSCSKCGSSPGVSDTGQHYADLVRGVFSWSGTRPCSAQWVGGGDQYNFDGWLPVVASEFQILGNLGNGTAGTGAPSGWTRTEYKDGSGNVRLQTNLGPTSQAHDLSNVTAMFGQVITFLGLDKPTGSCGSTTTGTGGSPGTGGSSSTGGTTATGGTNGAAGSKATGGSSSASGGAKPTGGAPSVGGSGTKATGGSNSGTGGVNATGGTPSGTGGTFGLSTGGSKSTGGAVSNTGGLTSAASVGGSSVTSVATGGSGVATVGGGAASGGNGAVGGESVTNTTPGSSQTGSCSCRVAGNGKGSSAVLSFGLLGLALAAWRRRDRR